MNEKVWISLKVSLRSVPKGAINIYSSIGSDHALEQNRWQAIIWSNNGIFYWHMYALRGLDDITVQSYIGHDEYKKLLKGLRMVDRALWRSEARRVVPWSETLHEP